MQFISGYYDSLIDADMERAEKRAGSVWECLLHKKQTQKCRYCISLSTGPAQALIHKKAQQQLLLLQELRGFNVKKKKKKKKEILSSVHRPRIESVLTSDIVSLFGHLSVRSKARLRLQRSEPEN